MSNPTAWKSRAICRDRDPKIFDGEDEYSTGKAKEICYRCPVVGACLTAAIINNVETGIWGAHTFQERESYKPYFLKLHAPNLPVLREKYKWKEIALDGRYERRLEKAKYCRSRIRPGIEGYNDFRQVLDLIIRYPDASNEALGKRLDRSESWFRHTLKECLEMVS